MVCACDRGDETSLWPGYHYTATFSFKARRRAWPGQRLILKFKPLVFALAGREHEGRQALYPAGADGMSRLPAAAVSAVTV
jgi:hypothetical protein